MFNAIRIGVCTALATLCLLMAGPARAETGIASWYSDLSVTASGKSYSSGDYVAAHKYLPLGTRVRVDNLKNGRSAIVRIVDRGPFIAGRIIDVSTGVANDLGFYGAGLTNVSVTVLGKGDTGGTAYASKSSSGGSKATKVASSSSYSAPAPKAQAAKPKPVQVASLGGGSSGWGGGGMFATLHRDGS